MKCIVNVAVGTKGSWYFDGQKRLAESLLKVNETSNFLFTTHSTSEQSPYQTKVNAIIQAYHQGYEQILYLDCSITALKPLDEIWSMIKQDGYYLYESGYNCANTSSDNVLNHFGLSRDTVEHWTEAATNVIGINTKHLLGEKMIRELQMDYIPECINTIKWPKQSERKADSEDERFMFNRQDQTVISLIAGKYGMKIHPNEFVWRDENDNQQTDKNIFRLKGGY